MRPTDAMPARGSWRGHLLLLGVLLVQVLVAAVSWRDTEELRREVRSGDPERMADALPVLAMRGDPDTFTPALLRRLMRSEHQVVRELAFCDELSRYVENRLTKQFLATIPDPDELRRCKFWMKKLGTHKINLTLQGLRLFLNSMDEVAPPPPPDDEGPP